MQIEALTGSTTIASLMSALTSLPSGLDGMYDWTLRRIEAQPQEESSLAKKALLWLTFSKTPLQIEELQCALATSYDAEGFDPQSVPPVEIILTACGGLVTTVTAKTLTGEAYVEVKLIREHAGLLPPCSTAHLTYSTVQIIRPANT